MIKEKNLKFIFLIIKSILFAFFYFLFVSINVAVIKFILLFFYLLINITTFTFYFLIRKRQEYIILNKIYKICILLLVLYDISAVVFFIYYTIYWILAIPGDGEEKFSILFSFFSGLSVLVFLVINWLNYLILKEKKSKS